jgi:predicted transcriptional regulator
MTDLMDKALARVQTWPGPRQDDVAELLLALDAMGPEPIDVDAATLAAIDEGLADIAQGKLADPAAVEAVFARFRK